MIEITPYNDTDFEELVLFLKKNWAQKHVLYRKELFDWQYKTADGSASLIAREREKIIGFLGNIPGKYCVDDRIHSGAGLTMWIIAPQYLSSGLGVLLLRETEKNYPVLITLGSKPEVVPLYEKLGFSHFPALRRFVIPLEAEGYRALLREPADEQLVNVWVKRIFAKSKSLRVPEKNINTDLLAELYDRRIRDTFAFSLMRDAEFWRWRYMESAGYRYLFFGDPESEGIIVARVESVTAPSNLLQPLKVLRIIELIPEGEELLSLLHEVLRWAKEQGCAAADFQTSTLRLAPFFETAGFRFQDENDVPPECSLLGRFQPLKLSAKPINFLWKVRDSSSAIKNIAPDDTYFVKSDCDMDRPSF